MFRFVLSLFLLVCLVSSGWAQSCRQQSSYSSDYTATQCGTTSCEPAPITIRLNDGLGVWRGRGFTLVAHETDCHTVNLRVVGNWANHNITLHTPDNGATFGLRNTYQSNARLLRVNVSDCYRTSTLRVNVGTHWQTVNIVQTNHDSGQMPYLPQF